MKEKGKRILTLVLALLMVFTSIWLAPVAARAETTQAEVSEAAEIVEETEQKEEMTVSEATEAEETQEETELEETADIPEVSEQQEADQKSATPVALENAGETSVLASTPGLYYREYEDNGEAKNTQMTCELNGQMHLYFYYDAGDGKLQKLALEDLQVSDTSIIEISRVEFDENVICMEPRKTGTTQIGYTVEGQTYTVDVQIELPYVGYYKAPVANEGNYISEFNLTDTSDTFYFVAKDDWEILNVAPADECKDILDVKLDSSGKYATVKVTGELTDGEAYCNLYYEAKSVDGYIGGGSNTEITIKNQRTRLGFYWGNYDDNYDLVADLEGELVQTWSCHPTKADGWDVFFYYVSGDRQTGVTVDNLRSTDTSVVTVEQSDANPNAVWLKVVGFGSAAVEYQIDGKTYQVQVSGELPEAGFYSTKTADESSYLTSYDITADQHEFYFSCKDGFELEKVWVNDDTWEDRVNVKLDSSKKFAVVTVSEVDWAQWLELQYTVRDVVSDETWDNGFGIALYDGKPHYFYPSTELQKNLDTWVNSVIWYDDSTFPETGLKVKDVKIKDGKSDIVTLTKTKDDDGEDLWIIHGNKTGQVDITITHEDPYDRLNDIIYTYTLTVYDDDEHEHQWNTTYTTDKAATYTQKGQESIHCSTCGEIKPGSAREIPFLEGYDASTKHFYAAGKVAVSQWYVYQNKKYLLDANGNKLTGWQYTGGTWYFLDQNGVMQTGWILNGNKWYYLTESGAMATGWAKDGNTWYYLDASGAMVTGWLKLGPTWYYLTGSGAMATGWIQVGNNWYYMNEDGAMLADTWIGNYYVNGSGAWIPGKTRSQATGWIKGGNRWWYRHADGSYTANGWERINGTWYFFDKAGWMMTGWIKDGNTWYYLTGSGAMATGWVQVGGNWYYLNPSGAMVTGWLMTGNTWYYLTSSGAMATGWLKCPEGWYYLTGSGVMATGWTKVGDTWYFLTASGLMAEDTWIGKYYVDQSGAWVKTK